MSDDLIKRYDVYHIYDPVDIEESHDGKFVYYSDYQARIEQLERENYQLIASLDMTNFAWDQAFHQRDEAEAKLAKAVEALNHISCNANIEIAHFARKVLVELEKP